MIAPASAAEVEYLTLGREGWQGRAAIAWIAARAYEPLASSADQFLGARELATFQGLEYPRRRTAYLLGRYAAKTALAQIVPLVDPRRIDVVPGCFQQPVIVGAGENLAVSISHAASAACALAFPEAHPMGIDVEDIDAARVDVMRTQLVTHELELTRAGDDAPTVTTVLWTAKEALSKTLRCGMTVPFELLAVDAMERTSTGFTGAFRNFAQYRYEACIRDGAIMTFVLPRKTVLTRENR